MKIFDCMVGGHLGSILQADNGRLHKPSNKREVCFYQTAQDPAHADLCLFLPRFYGASPMVSEKHVHFLAGFNYYKDHLLELEDVTKHLQHACVLDIKLGQRLYDDDATPEKRAKMEKQRIETTSGCLGLRICGVKIVSACGSKERLHGKEFGRALTKETFKDGLFSLFRDPKSGNWINPAVLECIVRRLDHLSRVFEEKHFRLYGSSVLLLFEGKHAWNKQLDLEKWRVEEIAKVHLIDFAHSHFEQGVGRDEGLLFGLRNLIEMLYELLMAIKA